MKASRQSERLSRQISQQGFVARLLAPGHQTNKTFIRAFSGVFRGGVRGA